MTSPAQHPLVFDVIVCTHRGGPFLREAIQSVRAQSYRHWHLTVVDDGAPDPSAIDRAVADVPDATVVHQSNLGVATARNVGIRVSSRDVVTFLDDDDLWPPGRLQEQADLLARRPDALGVFGGGLDIDADGVPFSSWRHDEHPRDRLLAGEALIPRITTLAIRRDAIEQVGMFDESFALAEDVEFILRLVSAGPLASTGTELVAYRRHGANLTNADWRDHRLAVRRAVTVNRDRARRTGMTDDARLLRQQLRRVDEFWASSSAQRLVASARERRWRDTAVDAVQSVLLSPGAFARGLGRLSWRSFPGRAVRHVRWRAERLSTAVIDRMRRGDRTVIMTPPIGPRLGNWMYLWLDAHQRSRAGDVVRVLRRPGMQPWLDAFPRLRTLTVAPERLRFHDRREWDEHSLSQRFGEDFTRDALEAFIRDCLLAELTPGPGDTLVVNVRRGDYYHEARLREMFGFDQVGYVAAALEAIGRHDRALVVSDDPQWCRANLDDLLRRHVAAVEYAAQDPVRKFRAIAGARLLIGANSTFSYWGGYVAGVMHPDARIVMPRFFARSNGVSHAYQLDPRWIAISGFD